MRTLLLQLRHDAAFLQGQRIYAPGIDGFIGQLLGAVIADAGGVLVDRGTVDYVFYLAGIADPTKYRSRGLETARCTIQLWDLLQELRGQDLQGFLYFSSSEIYGTAGVIPTPESYIGAVNTLGPRACYDEGKRFGETLCMLHAATVPVKIVRPFNNYGPGMQWDDGRAPAQFAFAALHNRPMHVYDETATRTCCYITDALRGYLKAIRHPEFEVFNIGNDHPEVTVLQLAQEFAKHGGQVVVEPPPTDDYVQDSPRRRCPDITKARQLLGYEPKVELADGIAQWMRWLQNAD